MSASAAALGDAWRSPRVANALAVGLALLGAWLLARLLWLVVSGPVLPLVEAPADAPRPVPERGSIAAWHLFGQPGPAAAAPTTALALTLRGTFASPDPRNGLAFIADAQGRERAYRTGETVLDDAVLEAVYPDHVLLRRAGGRERLPLGAGGDGEVAVPESARPAAAADPSGGYLSGPLSFGAPDLATARAAQAPALEALAALANLIPVTENGRLIGVRIAAPDPALLERIGLHPDEVVTAVNDIDLSEPGRREALEASLRGSGPLVLTVRRDGRERRLTVRN